MSATKITTAVLALCALAALILLGIHGQHWLAVHTGTVNESGPYYGFWSGFGSDLGEVTLITTVVAASVTTARHANCHVKGCWRAGKSVDGTPYRACHKHHPDHEGDARNVTLETIHKAHHQAKETK